MGAPQRFYLRQRMVIQLVYVSLSSGMLTSVQWIIVETRRQAGLLKVTVRHVGAWLACASLPSMVSWAPANFCPQGALTWRSRQWQPQCGGRGSSNWRCNVRGSRPQRSTRHLRKPFKQPELSYCDTCVPAIALVPRATTEANR